jgi:hypothetical protein
MQKIIEYFSHYWENTRIVSIYGFFLPDFAAVIGRGKGIKTSKVSRGRFLRDPFTDQRVGSILTNEILITN